jgi:hypothetical protein
MNMTAMIFSSLESEKAFMVMKNTNYVYTIFNIGGLIITSILVKIFSKSINKALKEIKEKKQSLEVINDYNKQK